MLRASIRFAVRQNNGLRVEKYHGYETDIQALQRPCKSACNQPESSGCGICRIYYQEIQIDLKITETNYDEYSFVYSKKWDDIKSARFQVPKNGTLGAKTGNGDHFFMPTSRQIPPICFVRSLLLGEVRANF